MPAVRTKMAGTLFYCILPEHLADFQDCPTLPKLAETLTEFAVSEEGHSAVEYAVIVALIVIACIATLTTIGTRAFQSTSAKL
jgi:pilus assembly protein Flp/PilA